ncbi:hypothetical protein [Leuconostoc mesenteroides]|uniref:hypothetical protein n=1 Tax=Leuconostoc mesenteroides TaxID=1245 RepID=UPI00235F6161|nr:hypothetical protein [Leuconostoc mesenteroides]
MVEVYVASAFSKDSSGGNKAVKDYLDILDNFDNNELLAIEKFIDALNQNVKL